MEELTTDVSVSRISSDYNESIPTTMIPSQDTILAEEMVAENVVEPIIAESPVPIATVIAGKDKKAKASSKKDKDKPAGKSGKGRKPSKKGKKVQIEEEEVIVAVEKTGSYVNLDENMEDIPPMTEEFAIPEEFDIPVKVKSRKSVSHKKSRKSHFVAPADIPVEEEEDVEGIDIMPPESDKVPPPEEVGEPEHAKQSKRAKAKKGNRATGKKGKTKIAVEAAPSDGAAGEGTPSEEPASQDLTADDDKKEQPSDRKSILMTTASKMSISKMRSTKSTKSISQRVHTKIHSRPSKTSLSDTSSSTNSSSLVVAKSRSTGAMKSRGSDYGGKKHKAKKGPGRKKSRISQGSDSSKDVQFQNVEEEEVIQQIVMPMATRSKVVKKVEKPKAKKKRKAKTEKKVEVELTEEDLKRIAEEEQRRLWEERRAAKAKEKRELMEDGLRGEQLSIISHLAEASNAALRQVMVDEQETEEWRQYLVCDGVPAPWDVPALTTYIHLWKMELYTVTAEQCRARAVEANQILEKLEYILDDPFDLSERRVENWAWVARQFREYLDLNFEYCTYRLLRDIKTKMNRISIPTADYRMQNEVFSLCLYCTVKLPTPNSVRSVPKRITLDWDEMTVNMVLPHNLKCELMAVRGIYVKYDHISPKCSTYKCARVPAYYKKSLQDACHEQLVCKQRYKYSKRVIVPKEPEETIDEEGHIVVVEPEPEPEIPEGGLCPTVPYQKLEPSASQHYINASTDEANKALIDMAFYNMPQLVINLRKYTVLGGVYYFDLFYQPPQPQGMVSYEVFLSTLKQPIELEVTPFIALYNPPAPMSFFELSQVEIEELMLQREKELDELIYIEIELPKHVYWLSDPLAVQWDDAMEGWSTRQVFDTYYIKEKNMVTLRSSVFRPIGLAVQRWVNLPYRYWEIIPETTDSVRFRLEANRLNFEFHVIRNTVCIRKIEGAPNNAFDHHLGVYYSFSKLRKIMRETGIDIFPFFDTVMYLEESVCEKYWPAENHLYFCLALISIAYNTVWSRWNFAADSRSMVFQMRSYRVDKPKTIPFEMVLVQPERTCVIECTENSERYSDTPIEGMRFYADLWHMIRATGTKSIRTQISMNDLVLVQTLYRLFRSIRFFSYS